jgi:hypothetical protein
MHEYEIRVLNENRTPSIVMVSIHLDEDIAITAGRRLAKGMAFEVWRDDERVYSTADDKPLRFPSRAR